MKRTLTRWMWLPLVALGVLLADQWTKGCIETHLDMGAVWVPFPPLEPWFKLVHYSNTGAAFGLLQGQSDIFVVVAVVVIVAVLVFARHLPAGHWGVRTCLGLQVGGAAGNLVDRLQHGHVTDFLLFTLPVGDRIYQWPAFNLADSSIVVGVTVLAILLSRVEGRDAAG